MGVGSYRQTVTICPDSITTMERFNILLVLDVSINIFLPQLLRIELALAAGTTILAAVIPPFPLIPNL